MSGKGGMSDYAAVANRRTAAAALREQHVRGVVDADDGAWAQSRSCHIDTAIGGASDVGYADPL